MKIRLGTTDRKSIKEVKSYMNRNAPMSIHENDRWLDLGANIGAFSDLVLQNGGDVVCAVEPESSNCQLLLENCPDIPILKGIVDSSSGYKPFYLCKTDYNKYRHSKYKLSFHSPDSIDIKAFEINQLIQDYSPNALKIDIEGAEYDILSALDENTKLNKLVLEWSFDIHPETKKLLRIVRKLTRMFRTVYVTKVNFDEPIYPWYPPQCLIWASQELSPRLYKNQLELFEYLESIFIPKKSRRSVNDKCVRTITFSQNSFKPFGRNKAGPWGPNKANTKYPELYQKLIEFGKFQLRKTFNNITLNKNFQCKPHRDIHNKSDSFIIGIGDYQGGELIIEGTPIDIKNRWYSFNGKKQTHWTAPFTGTRYTIIYYD